MAYYLAKRRIILVVLLARLASHAKTPDQRYNRYYTVMDYEKYDKFENEAEDDYSTFVDWLENLTVEELRQAKGDVHEQKVACCRYFKRGYRANLSTGELIDFLGVSSPSILDKAGYSDEECQAFFQISDALTDEEISLTEL